MRIAAFDLNVVIVGILCLNVMYKKVVNYQR